MPRKKDSFFQDLLSEYRDLIVALAIIVGLLIFIYIMENPWILAVIFALVVVGAIGYFKGYFRDIGKKIPTSIDKSKILERPLKPITEIETDEIDRIINEIKKYKLPRIRGKDKERKATYGLTSFLQAKYPEIKLEQPLGKGERIDAIIGRIGIEAKYRPGASEMDRLWGQIDRYHDYLDHIIVVLFKSDSITVEEFRSRLRKRNLDENVKIVNIT